MVKSALLFMGVLSLLFITSDPCYAQIYKWVDEKGTLHFSEEPPPANLRNQNKNQEKVQEKSQVKDQRRVKDQAKIQDKTVNNPATPEDTQAILKRLEIGNRQIPEDMKKYGPSDSGPGPLGTEQAATPPAVRRGSS